MIHLITNQIRLPDPDFKLSSASECLEYFKDHNEIEIDTETTGLDVHTLTPLSLQIGDFENQFVLEYSSATELLQFKDLLESKLCILAHAKYDYKVLKKFGINLNRVYDVVLAEQVLFCGYENVKSNLKTLVKKYCGEKLDKSVRNNFTDKERQNTTLSISELIYAAKDVKYLGLIKKAQEILIKKYDLSYCVALECEASKALGDIEYNGMFLNKKSWLDNLEFSKVEVLKLKQSLNDLVINTPELESLIPTYKQGDLFAEVPKVIQVNYSSPKQISNICTLLGYPVESTNAKVLEDLVTKHPFFETLIAYKKTAKIISTYGESFLKYIHPKTGRVHTSFWQIKSTGRVSSGSKNDNAPNLQNIPASNNFRNCFESRPGFSWVSIDYAAQELRLMAEGSKEEGFIDALNAGKDLHCFVGSMMFKRTITKEDKKLRTQAKTINFGKPYGMGESKLANTLKITKTEAAKLFKEYAEAFPNLDKWLTKQGLQGPQLGYSRTFKPCKRIRWYPETAKLKTKKLSWSDRGKIEGSAIRNAMNHPIQGSGADITKEALILVRNLIIEYNIKYGEEVAFLICTVHDQIDTEVRDDLAVEFSKKKEKLMIQAGNKYVTLVNMDVDTTITKVWEK
jgi:DNA polymerase-1